MPVSCRRPMLVIATLLALAVPAAAAPCGDGSTFSAWMKDFQAEARGKGISETTLASALNGIRFDPSIVARDRRQGVFAQTFLEFAGRMVSKGRLSQGAAMMKKHRATFERVERQFGVPASVITAFWGLETDYGANLGNLPTINSLATLAHDCRRPALFRGELFAALTLLDRGDLSLADMRGPWAGELGQVQFLPSYYVAHAIDFDGDNHPNLIRSVPDVLASAANLMRHFGWQPGQPWLVEVAVPEELPWEQADVSIGVPVSQWAAWGVTRIDGGALSGGSTKASLILPMGRNGPAFLAYPNFQIYLRWNQSLVYATTAAYFATRLDGAGQVRPGRAKVEAFGAKEIVELQRLLARRGYDVGPADGKLGLKSRAAIRAAQLAAGLPADGYPSSALFKALR